MKVVRRALAVLLFVLIPTLCGCGERNDEVALATAVGELDRRPLTARIAAFPHQPVRAITRSALASVSDGGELRARIVALKILNRDETTPHETSLAMLVLGKTREAVETLESIVRTHPKSATYWNDLAAARWELGSKDDAPAIHAAALAAADAALRVEPGFEPALFNRALALDALGLKPYALRAYERYCAADRHSNWATEALDRLALLRMPSRAEEWQEAKPRLESGKDIDRIVSRFPHLARVHAESDYLARWAEAFTNGDAAGAKHWLDIARAVGQAQRQQRGERLLSDAVTAIDRAARPEAIAKAHLAYRHGRLLYQTNSARVGEALPHLKAAQEWFETTLSPMSRVVAYYRANALFDAHESIEASAIIERLLKTTPREYKALHAQLYWLRSTISANRGEPYASLNASLESARRFMEIGEVENAARMEMASATTLGILGRHPEAHRLRRRAFESASAAGKASLWEVLLNSAARDEVRARRWDVAASLFALELEDDRVSPLLRVDALLWRAVADARSRDLPFPDLHDAHAAAQQLKDPSLRADVQNELHFVEATFVRKSHPDRAVELLTDVIEHRLKSTRMSPLATAYVERARAHGSAGDVVEQEADLRRAIEWNERRAKNIERDDLRDAFFGATADAHEELAELLVGQGRLTEAVEISEQSRARGLAERDLRRRRDSSPDAASLEVIARSIPRETLLVHYTTLQTRSLVTVLARGRPPHFIAGPARDQIRAQVDRLTESIVDGRSGVQRRAARWLYDTLIEPAGGELRRARTLVVVPDNFLSDVPFAALTSPSGRYLVQDIAIVVSPSASMFVAHGTEQPSRADTDSPLLIVGDPAFDRKAFPGLERLPSARSDVQTLARGRAASVLTASEATTARVVEGLQSAVSAHIAAHALANASDAWRSLIALAPADESDGALYLHQIADLDLKQLRLVTLAGCRTGSRGASSGSVNSIARAFLAAGAHNVVSTLWDVEDSATSVLTEQFYRVLGEGQPPAEALRAAQLHLLSLNHSSQHWAAVQLHGCNR